jgi:uncharacterized membrane protein YfbV (UPF0208 family)
LHLGARDVMAIALAYGLYWALALGALAAAASLASRGRRAKHALSLQWAGLIWIGSAAVYLLFKANEQWFPGLLAPRHSPRTRRSSPAPRGSCGEPGGSPHAHPPA